IMTIAERASSYATLVTFSNVFEMSLNKVIEAEAMNVITISQKVMFAAFDEYDKIRVSHKDWTNLTFKNAKLVWNNVKDVRGELDFMLKDMKIKASEDLFRSISILSKISKWQERAEYLDAVVDIFDVKKDSGTDFKQLSLQLKNEEGMLKDLKAVFDKFDNRIKILNDDCWKMIREMANARGLLKWLDGLRSDALNNVINGADDQSDEHLIQED